MNDFYAYYVHRMDPVVVHLGGSIALRWYGLAYMAGFLAGYALLVHWARKGIGELKSERVGDFLTGAALFGVILGGRLGYMLLYPSGREDLAANPLNFFKLWNGGMASHGGIMGLFFFTLYWSWKHKVSWTGLGDNLVVAAPVGLFCGRMANFINGELYGRSTDVAWAMQFPNEIETWRADGDFEKYTAVQNWLLENTPGDRMDFAALARENSAFAEFLGTVLTPRHPSQLYAAAVEGLLLFLILLFVRTKRPNAPHGLLTGLFFVLYAVFRIIDENYRQPDAYIMGLTEGQFYSVFLILIGVGFLLYSSRQKQPTVHAAAGV